MESALARLGRVFVPSYPRLVDGDIQSVDAYSYNRQGIQNLMAKIAGQQSLFDAEQFFDPIAMPEPDDVVAKLDAAETDLDVAKALQYVPPIEINGELDPKVRPLGDGRIVVLDDPVDDEIEFEVVDGYEWMNDQDIWGWFPNYEENWSKEFWERPEIVYHGTNVEYMPAILKEGLATANKTRGISNTSVGAAVFTSTESEDADYYYGDGNVLMIDTPAMAADGVAPYVYREPDVVSEELRQILAEAAGIEYEGEVSSDVSPNTIIFDGAIPAKYLSQYDG